MSHTSKALVAGLLMAIAASCASTKIISSWKEPSAGPLNFKKVLVLVMTKDESVRRAAEDQVVREITKTQAVASYSLFLADDLSDADRAKAKIKADGFDGAIIMRLVDRTQETSWVPGSYPAPYYSMYGYWGYGYGMAYDPGYVRTDTIVKIETNIYSVRDEKLIWSGLSESFNPTGPRDLIEGIAGAVAQELKKQGLIQ